MPDLPASSRHSRRLFIWGVLSITLVTSLGGFVLALPRIAPQVVIAHSPWIWPVLRAEAYETENKEPDLTVQTEPIERINLVDRIYDEEDWENTAIPVLTRALDHPDLRMRRTAVSTLRTLLTENEVRTPVIRDGELVNHLRRLLDEADDEVFRHAFGLLLHHENSASARAVLEHLPRSCGLMPIRSNKPWDLRFGVFWRTDGEPHPLRYLRLAPVVDLAQQWLATGDPEYVRLALMVLGHTDDVRALPIIDAHLGKHLQTDEVFSDGWDPTRYALSHSTLAGVNDLLFAAIADPDPLRRRAAADAVGEHNVGIDVSLALLRAHIEDQDEGVRKSVAIKLVYPLEQTLPDIHRIIARGGQIAVSVIDRIRSQRMFLHNSRPWWGRGVVVPTVDPDTPENRALETLIINEFAAFVTHPEPAVRFELARYLCSTWEPDTERVLRSMADDPDPQVRAEIAAELQAITTQTHRDAATYRAYTAPSVEGTNAP